MQNDSGIWGRANHGFPRNWPVDSEGRPEQPALLTNLPEGPIADMTRNMLEAYDIPAVEIPRENSGFSRVLLGATPFGIGLYVPASRQEEARQLLDSAPGMEDDEAAGSSENGEQ